MSRVLVTGASGLIGNAVARALAKDREVFVTGRSAAGFDGVDSAHRITLDLAGDWDSRAIPRPLDAVVHLAQSDNYRDFPAAGEAMFRVNTASTIRLLAAAADAGAKTFVLASTGGVYGSGPLPFREDSPLALDSAREPAGNLDFYLRTRRAAEILSAGWAGVLKVVVLRFFFVYGPSQKPSMLIPRLVRAVREGAPITLHGTDGMRMNPVYVDDAMRAVVASLGLRSSELLNVAGPDVLTMRDVGRAIGVAVGREATFSVEAGVPADLVGDIEKMSRLLGAPMIRFADGVRTL